MDVACLVRLEKIRIFHWEYKTFTPPVSDTRDVMFISLPWKGDTLDLFMVHLLSKYGGAGATAELRRQQTGQLAAMMDSVCRKRQRGWIMAAGDFNELYPAYSMEPLRSARFGGDSLLSLIPSGAYGSYKYRGRWMPIDQVLVQHSFPDTIGVSTPLLGPLLTEDPEYGGIKPRRCYVGFQYQGGISDHLPLLIDLNPARGQGPR
jgi:endonuclease/exonuclease/phosphatase family metal-dependent hydrolase